MVAAPELEIYFKYIKPRPEGYFLWKQVELSKKIVKPQRIAGYLQTFSRIPLKFTQPK